MQISIIGRHTDLPEELKQYINKKVQKLPRFYNRITSIEVIVDGDSRDSKVELIVKATRHQPLVAHESGNDRYASVDLAVDKMERQLRRHKERLRNHKHPERPDKTAQAL